MIKNAFPYQFLVDALAAAGRLNLPNFFKDLNRRGTLDDYAKLEEVLSTELQNAPLQNQLTVDYYLFVAREALHYAFFRADPEGFDYIVDLVKHRLGSLRQVQQVSVDLKGWEAYLELMETSFHRLIKHEPIEQFETFISHIDWGGFAESFIADISTLLGFVYLHEPDAKQREKARLWLHKSIGENEPEENLANLLFMAQLFLSDMRQDPSPQVEAIIQQLRANKDNLSEPAMVALFDSALFELELGLMGRTFGHFDDKVIQLEHGQQQLKEVESRLYRQRDELPDFARNELQFQIANLYAQLYAMTDDDLEQAGFSRQAIAYVDKAITQAEDNKDVQTAMQYRLGRADLALRTGHTLTEKELKESVQHYKKSKNYAAYEAAIEVYSRALVGNGNAAKVYDVVMDLFKYGEKRIETGGFYLLCAGMRLANDVFLAETHQPGVSWMVASLDGFFDRVVGVIDLIEENQDDIGTSLIEQFRSEYIRFEPVSHFNIKVYYAYQWGEIKMMRMGAMLYKDELTLKLTDRLLAELADENNPLSFIKGDWDDFKGVPNSVRNKTLNKCINISKGDLPLAAEHLDFSYRNLRSYITFKEVNRLGFFLDMQQTHNKQLEQGIRYMFYDLYKKGTIFEVVFDMPRFLVTYAQKGFYSQDLEQELNIKGTTAKKYIKIMMEIGLIRQDKTTGRKHYYRLIRENVMKRLGKDQNTLISSEESSVRR